MTNDLSARLRSHRWEEVDAALAEAAEHPEGDRIIADYVLSGNRSERLLAAALLGDLRGADGTAALRQLIPQPAPAVATSAVRRLLRLRNDAENQQAQI